MKVAVTLAAMALRVAALSGAPLNAESTFHSKEPIRVLFPSSSGIAYLSVAESGSAHLIQPGRDPVEIAPVKEQVRTALRRPDGSTWIISDGPYRRGENYIPLDGYAGATASPYTPAASHGPVERYAVCDLYSASGERTGSAKVLQAEAWRPLAATNEYLITLGDGDAGGSKIRFEALQQGAFKTDFDINLQDDVRRSIALTDASGNLLLIDRDSGNLLSIDLRTKKGAVARLSAPHFVKAAALDQDVLYLLSGTSVLKTRLNGEVLGAYECAFRNPSMIAASDGRVYLADGRGHVGVFRIP